MNFNFLLKEPDYLVFANSAVEAENILSISPGMSCAASRKTLELAVKWVYAADNTMSMPYKDNLSSLIFEDSFKDAIEPATWDKLKIITKLGNLAVHTNKPVTRSEAILSLSSLFEFIEWLDYCYGKNYIERNFDETILPVGISSDVAKIKTTDPIVKIDDKKCKKDLDPIKNESQSFTSKKDENKSIRSFKPEELTEYEIRKRYIDIDLKLLGFELGKDVKEEVVVSHMPNASGKGKVDYVLYGKDGLPIAIIEAKRTIRDPRDGKNQAKLYADSLEKSTGRRPIIFMTNGFDYEIWDDTIGPPRSVFSIFSKQDLEKLIIRRDQKKKLSTIKVSDKISDRYYQKEAIAAVCENIERGSRSSILVMATGTGKTRIASSLVDVLSRGNYVTNVLFLADRTALVSQAKDDFKKHLPDLSLCNLVKNKKDKNARIVFSTYPTILNAIDSEKNDEGNRFFTPAHFDLIIIDEAHRSIFKKYKVIFDYFDSLTLGLTATPRSDIDKNTYDFFKHENGVPTYAYDYETAVNVDKVLVPYHSIEANTKFLDDGIVYDELSKEDREKYEEDFQDEDGELPAHVPADKINKFIFNKDTVDNVLEHLMTKGLHVNQGDDIGKTIIFAKNTDHARFIEERFNNLYPEYKGLLAQCVFNGISNVDDIIDNFKVKDNNPRIAISVDMLDTGIDVPEVLNLVFFKKVYSKIKFWQMIGRGTRRCDNIEVYGNVKTCFYIFDYLRNFEFFRISPEGIEAKDNISLTESIFSKCVNLIFLLQHADYLEDSYESFREELVKKVVSQINSLNRELISVKAVLKYVDSYKDKSSFNALGEIDKLNLTKYIAKVVFLDEKDEEAKGFDNLMYGIMISIIEKNKNLQKYKSNLIKICESLLKKATIPKVKENIKLIKSIQSDEFWKNANVLAAEDIRIKLRDLMKLITEDNLNKIVYTDLKDEITFIKEGEVEYSTSYNFEDYKLKVNSYIEENKDNTAVYKLRNNIPMSLGDYENLQYVLTDKLGSKEDYEKAFGDTPFGLLVRKVAKLDQEAANEAFSNFITEEELNQKQIVFVKKVIDYIVQNGYIDNISDLTKAPFDKPASFIKLFDDIVKKEKFIKIINKIKNNAIDIVNI